MSSVAEATVIDTRELAPEERHASIFAAFQCLGVGATLELLGDHEPRPLHARFMQQWPGQFAWDTLEAGPAQWRTRVTRLAAGKSCCGCCGGG